MRRMLDQKELGGGGSGTARHGYSVVIGNHIHYEVYTQKDYDLKLRKATYISDFSTNTKYQELRSDGVYPASGYYNKNDQKVIGDKVHVMEIESSGFHTADYYVIGYNLSNNSYETIAVSSSPSVSVIKNF